MANLMKLDECRSWIGAWFREATLSRAAREFRRAATEQKANLEAMARLGRCKPSDLTEYSQCVSEIEAAADRAEVKLRESPEPEFRPNYLVDPFGYMPEHERLAKNWNK